MHIHDSAFSPIGHRGKEEASSAGRNAPNPAAFKDGLRARRDQPHNRDFRDIRTDRPILQDATARRESRRKSRRAISEDRDGVAIYRDARATLRPSCLVSLVFHADSKKFSACNA
jgi:hypothetical protein